MNHKTTPFICLLSFVLFLAAALRAQDSTVIQGKVLIGQNGPKDKAVPNALVTWKFGNGLTLTDTTGADGFYSVKAIITGMERSGAPLVKNFRLFDNYPNPFNPVTVISWQSPVGSWHPEPGGHVQIRIYNALGQKVKTLVNENRTAGVHYALWDGTNDKGQKVASGQYYYGMESNDFHKVKKMTYLKHVNARQPGGIKARILHKTGLEETIQGIYDVSETDSTLSATGTGDIITGQTNDKDIYVVMKDFPPEWLSSIGDDTLGINQEKVLDMKSFVKDVNLDALSYMLSQHPDGFTYSTAGDVLTITPKKDYLGDAGLRISAADPDTATQSNTFHIFYIDDRYNVIVKTHTPDSTYHTNQKITIGDVTDTTTIDGALLKLVAGNYSGLSEDLNEPKRFNDANFSINVKGNMTYDQLITEIYNYLGTHDMNADEGATIGIAKNWFKYATSLKKLQIMNKDRWTKTGEDQDSIYVKTNDTNLFGNDIPLILKAIGEYDTENTEQILVDIKDMITINGKLGDNNTWKNPIFQGDNSIEGHYGLIANGTDTTYTDAQGNYTIKVPKGTNITLHARATLQDGTPRSYTATFSLGTLNQDIQNKILNLVLYKYIEQAELTPEQFKQFAYDVNFAPNQSAGMNFEGLKTFDKDSLNSHITRDSDYGGYEFSNDEQNYIETIERDSLFGKMQKKDWPIHKASLGEPKPYNKQGVRVWQKNVGAPAFGITGNDDKPGTFFYVGITVSGGEPTYLAEIMEEGASGLFGCNDFNEPNLSYPYMERKTVLHGLDPPGHGLSISDITLLRIVENYLATTHLDDVLGL